MYEILDTLDAGARVLDLGCRSGSFDDTAYPFLTVRVDLGPGRALKQFVRADAVQLPFRARSFDAVILNHSLEHMARLKPALQEAGRVLKKDGAAFVSVPDATTLSDRIYRKVYRNSGGHMNLFASPRELQEMLSWYLGLPHVATRPLLTSLSFLNRKNLNAAVRSQMRFGGLDESSLALAVGATRLVDRMCGTRASFYGWAFYFGTVRQSIDTHPLSNVCIRCGRAHSRPALIDGGNARTGPFGSHYVCPGCGARNLLLQELDSVAMERRSNRATAPR